MGSSLAWVIRMTSFACQGSFFSRRFSDLIYEMGSNALNTIEGPYYPSSYTNPSLRMQEGIFRSFKKRKLSVVRKNGNLKLVNCLQQGFHGNIVAK